MILVPANPGPPGKWPLKWKEMQWSTESFLSTSSVKVQDFSLQHVGGNSTLQSMRNGNIKFHNFTVPMVILLMKSRNVDCERL